MATTQRKGKPYIWASWLAKALAGDMQCQYALWFPSRFKFDKVERDFDMAAWSADHDVLVQQRAYELKASKYVVSIENDNYFQLKGQTAIIAGKMDLVARQTGHAIVLDGKSGDVQKRDWWQVLIYMAVLPLAWKTGSMRISGEVFYKTGQRITIEPEELTQERRAQIFAKAKEIGSMTAPPPKSPSPNECRRCDISTNDCPERMDNMDDTVTETDVF